MLTMLKPTVVRDSASHWLGSGVGRQAQSGDRRPAPDAL